VVDGAHTVPSEYLFDDDVPARLLTLIEKDIAAIVESGILSYDLKAAAQGGRGGPPRVRRRK
jgi:hypothetical protein